MATFALDHALPADPPGTRRCLLTGERKPRDELIRFVIAPDGTLTVDLGGRLPGRGLWLSADKPSLETACRKKAFSRAARANVVIPGDIGVEIERLLVRRCLDFIGLARRAGTVVAGYEKTRAWLTTHEAGVLLAASDSAASEKARLRGLTWGTFCVDTLSAAELGQVFGRARAVHGAMERGPLSSHLIREARRLSGFRTVEPVSRGIRPICTEDVATECR